MAETVKRTSRKSSSASSTDDNLSPDGKILRHDAWLSDSELCESDEVFTILNMAGEVILKLEQVLEKLENLERYVKAVDEEVSNLQAKVDCFQKQNRKKDQRAGRRIGFCEHGMRSFKEKFDKLNAKLIRSGTRNYTWKYISGGKIFVFSELKKKPIRRRTRERF